MTMIDQAIVVLSDGQTYDVGTLFHKLFGRPLETSYDRTQAHTVLSSVRRSLRDTNKALHAQWIYEDRTVGKKTVRVRSHKVYQIGSRWMYTFKADEVNGRNSFDDGIASVQAVWTNVYQQLKAGKQHVYNNKSDDEIEAVFKEMRKMQRAFNTISKSLTAISS